MIGLISTAVIDSVSRIPVASRSSLSVWRRLAAPGAGDRAGRMPGGGSVSAVGGGGTECASVGCAGRYARCGVSALAGMSQPRKIKATSTQIQ